MLVLQCSFLILLILFFYVLILFIMSLDNSSNVIQLDCSPTINDAAFESSNDGDLLDFVCPSQAARNIFVDQFDLCDSLFGSLAKNIQKCKYRDANFTFNDFNDRDTLMLLHVNARSLHKNFYSLYGFLEPLKHKPHVISISESQITSQHLLNLGLENYSFAHVSLVINRVGCVAVYVHNDISFRICRNQFALTNSESLWIKINNNMGWIFTVGIVYRQPDVSKVNNFIEDLSTCTTEICSSNETFFILGELTSTYLLLTDQLLLIGI